MIHNLVVYDSFHVVHIYIHLVSHIKWHICPLYSSVLCVCVCVFSFILFVCWCFFFFVRLYMRYGAPFHKTCFGRYYVVWWSWTSENFYLSRAHCVYIFFELTTTQIMFSFSLSLFSLLRSLFFCLTIFCHRKVHAEDNVYAHLHLCLLENCVCVFFNMFI